MKRKSMWVGAMLAIFSLGGMSASSLEERFCAAGGVLYVAPAGRGTADGHSREDAVLYTSTALWEKVNVLLEQEPVTVSFADGVYASPLSLDLVGNDRHTVTLKGESPGGVVFDGLAPVLFELRGCRNMVVDSFNFTGEAPGYAFKITKYCPPEFYAQFNEENKLTAVAIGEAEGTVSKNITVRNCNWHDMEKLYYGATGASYGAHHVAFENCTFKRIGSGTHSHMIYNAYGPTHVSMLGCHFEDCAGSYVRFRAASDYGVVSSCTFVSTQTYAFRSPSWEIFLDFPTFNDVDPGDETFALYATIANNTFQFSGSSPANRATMRIYHKGFDPPGWNYLMTAPEGAILEGTDGTAKKNLLENNCGFDFDEIAIGGNTWLNETARIMFGSYAGYGADSKGWNDIVDVSDTVFDP